MSKENWYFQNLISNIKNISEIRFFINQKINNSLKLEPLICMGIKIGQNEIHSKIKALANTPLF